MTFSCRVASKITVIYFLFTLAYPAQAQQWARDSLDYYRQQVDDALKTNHVEKAVRIHRFITKKGYQAKISPEICNYFTRSLRQNRFSNFPRIVGELTMQLGILEARRGNREAFRKYCKQAMLYNRTNVSNPDTLYLMKLEADRYYFLAQPDSSAAIYQELLNVYEKQSDSLMMATCYMEMAYAYYSYDKNVAALKNFNASEAIFNQLNKVPYDTQIRLWWGLSASNLVSGRYSNALEYTLRSLDLSKQFKDSLEKQKAYKELAVINSYIPDDENFLKYIYKAHRLARQLNNPFLRVETEYNMANYYREAGFIDSALYYIEPVIDFYTKNENNTRLVELYTNKGLIHAKDDRPQLAIESYLMALANSSETSEHRKAIAFFHLGEAYISINRLQAARKALGACYQLALKKKSIDILEQVTAALAAFHKREGNYQAAFNYLSQNKQYADSLIARKNASELTEIKTRYETHQKDQQIKALAQQNKIQQLITERQEWQQIILVVVVLALLGVGFVVHYRSCIRSRNNRQLAAKNRELAQKNELIQSQSEEKALLLKEVHHRVKNNLQIISSLLNLQTREEQDRQVLEAVKESQNRVKTMALLHEKLYQNQTLSSIHMQEYMNQLAQFLKNSYQQDKEIQVLVDAGNITLDVNTAVPVGLITNELLSNALKHAFEKQKEGLIQVTLREKAAGKLELKIQDNGVGLDQTMNFDNLSSLGLKLVHTLTRQINGQLTVESEKGTTFAISFSDKMVAA